MNAIRSELFLLRRRAAGYVTCGIWILLALCIYMLPLLLSAAPLPGQQKMASFSGMSLPEAPGTILVTYAAFGGTAFLILGAFIGGSEFDWGTWKTRLWQGPSRWGVVRAKFVTALVASTLITVATTIVGFLTSFVVSTVNGLPNNLPGALDVLGYAGASILIAFFFYCLGLCLAIITRNLALALAIGLVWTLAIETLVSQLATMWSPLAFLQKILPRSAATGLAAPFNTAQGQEGLGITSDITDVLPPAAALVVLLAYLTIAIVVSGIAINRRDVT